jgi:phenylacetate-coenzyme A ligase PaaK-like adenylate-forming protein
VLANGLADEAESARLEVAIANAEPVLAASCAMAVRSAFGCELRETYGMAEIAVAASECEQGWLHEWPDVSEWSSCSRAIARFATASPAMWSRRVYLNREMR